MRPVERVFIGDADASEAIYRLLKAAREGKRAQEVVRIAGIKGRPPRWLHFKIRPLGDGRRSKGASGERSRDQATCSDNSDLRRLPGRPS